MGRLRVPKRVPTKRSRSLEPRSLLGSSCKGSILEGAEDLVSWL